MSAHCCHVPGPAPDSRYRRVLWVALAVNAAMFVTELAAGIQAGSVSLQADALDFLGDTANYGISLFVLGMALTWRAGAAFLKGLSMGLFGVWVLGHTLYHAVTQTLPAAGIMGAVGVLALLANVAVAVLLYRFRSGDSNMRSVWLCSRNDAIGNVAVVLAAVGVVTTGTGWPDVLVAGLMATLALSAAGQVLRQSLGELRGTPAPSLSSP